MENWRTEEIPNSWVYWKNVGKESYYGVSHLVDILREFGSNSDFLIDGVDFTIYCPERPTSVRHNQEGSGKSLELVAKYVSLNFGLKNNLGNARIEHDTYDCPYTGTPEKSHLFKVYDDAGERSRLSFIYGPNTESERRLFWDPPERSYQESNPDKN